LWLGTDTIRTPLAMLLFPYSLVFTRIRKGIERNKKENLKSTQNFFKTRKRETLSWCSTELCSFGISSRWNWMNLYSINNFAFFTQTFLSVSFFSLYSLLLSSIILYCKLNRKVSLYFVLLLFIISPKKIFPYNLYKKKLFLFLLLKKKQNLQKCSEEILFSSLFERGSINPFYIIILQSNLFCQKKIHSIFLWCNVWQVLCIDWMTRVLIKENNYFSPRF